MRKPQHPTDNIFPIHYLEVIHRYLNKRASICEQYRHWICPPVHEVLTQPLHVHVEKGGPAYHPHHLAYFDDVNACNDTGRLFPIWSLKPIAPAARARKLARQQHAPLSRLTNVAGILHSLCAISRVWSKTLIVNPRQQTYKDTDIFH